MATLNKFPMPPSVNQLYANNFNGSGRGRYKTKIYQQFEKDCQMWQVRNWQKVASAQLELKDANFVSLKAAFYFPKNLIITKLGKAKKLDLDNRLKGLLDQLTDLLKFDDSSIFELHCYKLIGSESYVDLELNTITLENADAALAG